MIQTQLLLIGYFIMGLSLKYIDRYYRIRKKQTLILAIFTALLMALFIAYDTMSANIFGAIIIGSLITQKIDNLPFKAGFIVIVLILMIFKLDYSLLTLIPLSIAAAIDEYGNKKSDKIWFRYRFSMKTCVFGGILLNLLVPMYFIAFMLFDIGYHLIEKWE